MNAINNEELINSILEKLIDIKKKHMRSKNIQVLLITSILEIVMTSIDGQKHINVSGPILECYLNIMYINNDTINFAKL